MRREIQSVLVVTSVHPSFDGRIWKHCNALAKAGIRVHLVCPWDVQPGESVKKGVVFHPFERSRGMRERLTRLPGRIAAVVKPLLSNCDLVHIHDPDLLPLALRWLKYVPVVYDCHENLGEEIALRPYVPRPLKPVAAQAVSVLERRFVRRIGFVVMVTPAQEEYFQRTGAKRLLIGNQASEDILAEVRSDWGGRASAVVFIGTQHERNGSLIFLQVAALLARRYPGLRFLASDRFPSVDFRKHYLALAAKLGVLDRLDLPANVPAHNIMEVLNRGTVGINPNLRIPQQIKGNHTKMYEFMAAGLPVVASDLPHQKTLVEACESGLLAQPESVASFAEQCGRLLEDTELRLRLGSNAQRAFREKYCFEQQIPELIDFYLEAMNRRG